MFMNMRRSTKLGHDESGFASLVVALTLILVLSLITVGFAQLARREQQDALSNQLSTQAYYAAESGVNDAYAIANTTLLAHIDDISRTQCLDNTYLPHRNIDAGTGVSYSCVMVDLKPTSLQYSNVSPDSGRNVSFSDVDLNNNPTDLRSITLSWSSYDGHKTLRGDGSSASSGFETQAGWGNAPPVIEVSVTPFDPNNIQRDTLINATFYAYLYPQKGANDGKVDFSTSPATNTPIVNANCNGTGDYQCSATIEHVPGDSGTNYLIHFKPRYDAANVIINGKDSNDKATGFKGGQVVIDSTGRAKDTLKRIRVHAPLTATIDTPAIESQNICKRIQTYPDLTQYDTSLGSACDLSN
jgi:hypothetical protein